MNGETSELSVAFQRLERAIDAAESAVGRALDAADAARDREQELQAFADDRLRLVELLDASAAQVQSGQKTRDEVAKRLDAAIEAIETVLTEPVG